MSYTSLSYTQAMRLYKRNAMVIIKDLPKGCIRKAGQVLEVFLSTGNIAQLVQWDTVAYPERGRLPLLVKK